MDFDRQAMRAIVREMVGKYNQALKASPNPLTWNEMRRILQEEVGSKEYARRLSDEAGVSVASAGHAQEPHYRVF